eukprot:CAMPEP_0204269938 /NCGR_PEP_ID=MMETSP0468-20130131/17689_1 /ASSEMBLY_ACC=CAM_ASM_000383 /TAXON_ID=2969 /ORGANISM="Oxyrrhis marina" /LENGTH=518 /DNA_ID=CAMNT_0051245409 /DNA_START=29 /DNA_END=1585 /DNA_ORIENTATION=+
MAVAFLSARGLESCAAAVVEEAGAEEAEDFGLLTEADLQGLVATLQLKPVQARKLTAAVAEVRGTPDAAMAGTTATAAPEPCPAVPTPAPAPTGPEEYICVCIDHSGSMGSPFAEDTIGEQDARVAQRTRLQAVKQMFYAFRDRAERCGQRELGLVQFDNSVETLLDMTPDLGLFESAVDHLETGGTTAIYSAVQAGVKMVNAASAGNRKADLRVVLLTDGQNNHGISAQEALDTAALTGVVVDAIIVGNIPDGHLRRIVTATGGQCFQITSIGAGFELLEADTVVSMRARRGGADKPEFVVGSITTSLGEVEEKIMATKATKVIAPTSTLKTITVEDALTYPLDTNGAKRVVSELQKVNRSDPGVWYHSGAGIHIFPSEEPFRHWRVLMEGPEGSPFEGGVFLLKVDIPSEYPFRNPKIEFETPIYHCNFSDSGTSCVDILGDQWSPALTIPRALECLRQLVKDPAPRDAQRAWIAEETIAFVKSEGTDTRYVDKARAKTLADAGKTVAEWKAEWGL